MFLKFHRRQRFPQKVIRQRCRPQKEEKRKRCRPQKEEIRKRCRPQKEENKKRCLQSRLQKDATKDPEEDAADEAGEDWAGRARMGLVR